jgi:hypothetical protein
MDSFRLLSGVQIEEAEEGEGVGGLVDAGFEEVVEGEGIFGVGAGHVDVFASARFGGESGEGEVVGGEGSEGSGFEECVEDG